MITAENARELQKKGVEARRAAKLHLLSIQKESEAPVNEPNSQDDFAIKTLVRVRAQLNLVNERLTEQLVKPTLDPQAIDRLASAQSRLSEQERILAGRPTPGALRPASGKRDSRRPYSAPVPSPTPPPVVVEPKPSHLVNGNDSSSVDSQ